MGKVRRGCTGRFANHPVQPLALAEVSYLNRKIKLVMF